MVDKPIQFYDRSIKPIQFYDRAASAYQAKILYAGVCGNLVKGYTTGYTTNLQVNLVSQTVNASTYRRIVVARGLAPGIGKKIKCTLRRNFITTNLSVSLVGTQTYNYADFDVPIDSHDYVDTQVQYIGSVSNYGTGSPLTISYAVQHNAGNQTLFGRSALLGGAAYLEMPGHCNIENAVNKSVGPNDFYHGFWLYSPTSGALTNMRISRRQDVDATNNNQRDSFFWTVDAGTGGTNYNASALNRFTTLDASDKNFVDSSVVQLNSGEFRALIRPQHSPGPDCTLSVCTEFVPDTPGEFIYTLHYQGVDSGVVTETPICGNISPSQASLLWYNVVPYEGDFTKIQCYFPNPVGAGETVIVTLRKNHVDTALTMTINSGGVSGVSTGTVSVVLGDIVSFAIDQTNGDLPGKGVISTLFKSDSSVIFPNFYAEACSGSLPTAETVELPVNFYSLP